MECFLNPARTLVLEQDWLDDQANINAADYTKQPSVVLDPTEIQCQWRRQGVDTKLMDLVKSKRIRLVRPPTPLTKHNVPNVEPKWVHFFLAMFVQQKLKIRQLFVDGHHTSHIFMTMGTKNYKLMLESPINLRSGTKLLPDVLEKLDLKVLKNTGIFYRKKDKVYVLIYYKYALTAGPDDAIASIKAELAKNFDISELSNLFTYQGMYVRISEFNDGHSVSIDCDSVTDFSRRGAFYAFLETSPRIIPETVDYLLKRELVEMALQIEDAEINAEPGEKPKILSEKPDELSEKPDELSEKPDELSEKIGILSEPLDKNDTSMFRGFVKSLKLLEAYGRMDVSAVRVYLESTVKVRRVHWEMLRHVCHYVVAGPPYRLKYEYQPNAKLNMCTATRWFPLPIGTYAWFYGDCPIMWHSVYAPPATESELFGVSALRSAWDAGQDFIDVWRELGLLHTKDEKPEVATPLYDLVVRSHRSVSELSFLRSEASIVPMTRRGEPFTFAKAEDAELDVKRTLEQNQAKSDRVPVVSKNERSIGLRGALLNIWNLFI